MAGHSHWAGIKHKKAVVDAKRGKLFSKIAKMIITAARLGGPDPDANLKLKYAIEKARAANMPKDNIERAIKRGSGQDDSQHFEEILYEGYGPGGVGILMDILTDNRNRTAPEIRKIFERRGGSLAASGSVSYRFERKGLFILSADAVDEDTLMEAALESGAEDMKKDGDQYQITSDPSDFIAVKGALEEKLKEMGVQLLQAEISYIPKNTVAVDRDTARKVIALLEDLDEHDDVENAYCDADFPQEVLDELSKS